MYDSSQIIGQIGGERQRDALARAEQQRRAQRLRVRSRTARQAAHPGRRRMRTLARLRTVLARKPRSAKEPQPTR